MQYSDQSISFKRKSRNVSTFLKKTYTLLNNQDNQKAIRWAPNGIGFIIVNQSIFSEQVLPKYFKHNNYSSFVRQLNMYNFHKTRQSNEESYFIHQCFDRFNQHKLSQIKRKPEKKKRKICDSDYDFASQNQEQKTHKSHKVSKIQKQGNVNTTSSSLQKVEDDRKTINYISETCNPDIWLIKQTQQNQDEDKISINNEIPFRIIPRLPTRQLIFPSNNNLYPFTGSSQASMFCLFF